MNGLPLIIYDNRFADGTPVASGTAAGDFDPVNLTDFRPYTWWQPDALPATVTVDCGAAQSANSCVVYGHDLGSQAATLEVRYSSDNFAADDNLAATISPTDDKPIMLLFAEQSVQYWRVRITGVTVPSLAVVALGKKLELPRRLRLGFDPLGRTPVSNTNRSDKGHPLGQSLKFEEWSETINIKVSSTWLRDTFLPVWNSHLKLNPWLWGWDPTDHSSEIYLVTSPNGFKAPSIESNRVDLQFAIKGVVA